MAVAVGTQYQQLCEAVKNYYGAGSDQWLEIAQYGVGAADFKNIVSQVPGVNVTVAKDGTVLGYSINEVVSTSPQGQTVAEFLNSNTMGATNSAANSASVNIPASTGVASGGTAATAQSGVSRVYQAGQAVSSGLKFVTGEVLPAVAAVATGAKLGKTFADFFYNTWPGSDFWDSIGLSTMNPETWNSITTDYDGPTVLKSAFNTIFGLNPDDGKMQMYIDEDALSYLALYMANGGVFSTGARTDAEAVAGGQPVYSTAQQVIDWVATWAPQAVVNKFTSGNYAQRYLNCSLIAGAILDTGYYRMTGIKKYATTVNITKFANKVIQLQTSGSNIVNIDISPDGSATANSTTGTNSLLTGSTMPVQAGWTGFYQVYPYTTAPTSTPLPGTDTQPGATTPNTTGWTTPADTKTSLQTQYPDLWDNRIEQDVLQPDGTVKTIKYVPVAMPDGVNTNQPTNTQQPTVSGDTTSQAHPEVDPSNTTDSMLQTIIDILTSPNSTPSGQTTPQTSPQSDSDTPLNPDEKTPDTGTGTGPVVVLPNTTSSALWAVYNPTPQALIQFGSWLWSNNFVDQILKLFSDPMQAIIGLHRIYVPIPATFDTAIAVGYLNSGVQSNVVTNQYVTVNCGSVNCFEYFGNVFDYSPFTRIQLYLPFIGIVDLDPADVMRGVVSVVYKVDVISGACLAEVSVSRDASGGVLYTYAGDCAVRYPYSSGSYMGIVGGILSIAGGIAATVASGGAAMPALLGAGAGLGNLHTNIKHGGSISGNAGAMGSKIPYLIVSRPQTATAKNYQKYQGIGANSYQSVANMSGYFKMDDCRLTGVTGATKEELEEIRVLLKTGVIK